MDNTITRYKAISGEGLARILQVTRKLAAPFDLMTMLDEVLEAACSVLKADSGTVWLYDPSGHELVMQMRDTQEFVRVPADKGIVGEAAQTRATINVPDCYADPRFNPEVDRESGYITRCMLTIPLVGHDDALVGVLQVLNKRLGVFDEIDESIAAALAAQCAVALQRARMTEDLLASEKLKQEISMARDVQMNTLPTEMPQAEGYDFYGMFMPADETGGDTFDLVRLSDDRIFILMGDATGHGIAPALSATQMQAMLRVAFRLNADLDDAFVHMNNQLCEDLPNERFVTAFVGLLYPAEHRIRYHSGGQGPILHFRGSDGHCDWFAATCPPLGALELEGSRPAENIELAVGDILGLITDGIYEYENEDGEQFGMERVAEIFRAHRNRSAAALTEILLEEVYAFGGDAEQGDDITVVLVKREA